jgi:hypothetical protein
MTIIFYECDNRIVKERQKETKKEAERAQGRRSEESIVTRRSIKIGPNTYRMSFLCNKGEEEEAKKVTSKELRQNS